MIVMLSHTIWVHVWKISRTKWQLPSIPRNIRRAKGLLCGKEPDHFLMSFRDGKLSPLYLLLHRAVGISHVRIGHKEKTLPSTLHLVGFIRESESMPLYVCVLMNAVSMEAGRGHQILWAWSYRRLVTVWVLGTDPGACTRTVSVLNSWAIPLAHFLLILWN